MIRKNCGKINEMIIEYLRYFRVFLCFLSLVCTLQTIDNTVFCLNHNYNNNINDKYEKDV